jgi:TolB protein
MRFRASSILAAALCVPPLFAAPALAGDVFNGRIGFTSFRVDPLPGAQRTGDIFSISPAGTGLRQLTDDRADDAQTDWAPTGEAIAYRIRKPGSRINFEVARMPAAGGERTVLTDTPLGQASSQPTWFPDMGGIMFRRSGSGGYADVWTMGTLGQDPRVLLELPGGQLYPSYSPDMTKVLFATTLSPVGDTDRGIFTANPDGSGLTSLFDVPGVYDSAPAWSPDGRRIAFESDADLAGGNPERDREIFVMDADGANVVQLTRNADHDEGPAWAPDGSMLAYTSGPDDLHGDIHVMTAAGVHLDRLTSYAGRDESPDWQPIPAPDTERRCGDLGAGPRDVRAAGPGLACEQALELAGRWTGEARPGGRPDKVAGFDAEVADYGGTLRVTLEHRGDRKLVVFLVEE